jgi:hypothetical protein
MGQPISLNHRLTTPHNDNRRLQKLWQDIQGQKMHQGSLLFLGLLPQKYDWGLENIYRQECWRLE